MLSDYYQVFKSLHIISMICWIAGMLYVPRLFVYHSMEDLDSKSYSTFLTMERKLLNFITVPAMFFTYIFGILCSWIYGLGALGAWFHIKITCVIGITIMNYMYILWYKNFLYKRNTHTTKFFRIVNEIPTVLMIIAVFMVVLKPFE